MENLTAFDIFFFAAVGILALLGLRRGFVGEVLGLFAWVGGIVAVNIFFAEGEAFAAGLFGDGVTASVATVLGVFLVTFAILRLVGNMIAHRVKQSVIGPIDRVLGFGFGAVKGLLVATLAWMLLTLVFDLAPGQRPDWLVRARSGPVVQMFAGEVRQFVEERRAERARETGYDEEQRDDMDALFGDAVDE